MSVYLVGRDLNGVFFGKHSFLVIELESSPHPPALNSDGVVVPIRKLPNGKTGYIVGGHSVHGKLVVKFFENADHQAVKEHYQPKKYRFWNKSDFDAEVHRVKYANENKSIRYLISLINNFVLNQSMDEIKYPTAGLGYNCHSWVQSLIKYTKGESESDLNGIDPYSNHKIPKTYFLPICTSTPRPKLN